MFINPFSTNVPFLYPLKTSENRRFYDESQEMQVFFTILTLIPNSPKLKR